MPGQKLKKNYHADPFNSSYITCFNYNNQDIPKKEFTIGAFDPGFVNTGFRIEKRSLNIDNKIIPETIIQRLIISDKKNDPKHFFVRMTEEIFNMKDEIEKCDFILVESQMHNNPRATRMCQHIISTLLGFLYDSKTLIMEVEPTIKSRSFGVKGIRGKELKKWAIVKALEILTDRNDDKGVKMVKESKKQDDQCDVILYCDSWARYLECNEFKPDKEELIIDLKTKGKKKEK